MLAVRRASPFWLVGAVSVLLTSAPLALPRDVMAESEPLDVIGPVIDGRRVEQPAYGFTITFPDDWTVRSATPEGLEAYWGESETPPGQSLVLAAERSPHSGHCLVTFDDPSERDEPVLLAWYADWIETGWAEDVNQHVFKRTQVELPAGPAWRIDYAADWWSGSVYTLRGPQGLYTPGSMRRSAVTMNMAWGTPLLAAWVLGAGQFERSPAAARPPQHVARSRATGRGLRYRRGP